MIQTAASTSGITRDRASRPCDARHPFALDYVGRRRRAVGHRRRHHRIPKRAPVRPRVLRSAGRVRQRSRRRPRAAVAKRLRVETTQHCGGV